MNILWRSWLTFSAVIFIVLLGFSVLSLLQHAAWPGNVRELRNVIERACILSEAGLITERDLSSALSAPLAAPAPDAVPDDRLSTLQHHQIERVLDEAGGNKSEAARRLGISRRALYRRIDEMA